MSISSMTGFARAVGELAGYDWSWEVRSVNSKGLDIRCRLPGGLESIESDVRAAVGAQVSRGSVSLTLVCRRTAGAAEVTLNHELLDQLGRIADEVSHRLTVEPPRLDGLLAVKGVLTVSEPDEGDEELAARKKAIMGSLAKALGDLVAARDGEGARTGQVLRDHLAETVALITQARQCAGAQPAALKDRLKTQVDAILEAAPSLSDERVIQEVAVLVTRADVSEELDRLVAHVAAAHELLDSSDPVGRKLDFLAQEFNREANTLCSKAADLELTQIGLELKAVIDRLREQVANIE
jgi:uncharacterized protein (TIGR00255 family)